MLVIAQRFQNWRVTQFQPGLNFKTLQKKGSEAFRSLIGSDGLDLGIMRDRSFVVLRLSLFLIFKIINTDNMDRIMIEKQ